MSSEKYYFHCPKNVLCSILNFVFWIFPPLDTAVQLESADLNNIQFQNLFFMIVFGTFLGQWEKCIILSGKNRPLICVGLFGIIFTVLTKTLNVGHTFKELWDKNMFKFDGPPRPKRITTPLLNTFSNGSSMQELTLGSPIFLSQKPRNLIIGIEHLHK